VRLVVLTPSRGSISVEQRKMLVKLAILLKDRGHHLGWHDDTIPGLLHQSRASLLYLLSQESDDTRGLWLDADVYFDWRRVLWAMDRSEDMIVWTYPVRIAFDVQYPPEVHYGRAALIRAEPVRTWTATPKVGAYVSRSDDGKLVELKQCGLGAALMTSSLARAMQSAYGPAQSDRAGKMISGAFESMPYPDDRTSEDIGFCRRLQAQGHRIWCDPVPYVTNGQCGGRFSDEIRLREAAMPWLFAQFSAVGA